MIVGTPEELSRHLWQLDKDKKYKLEEYKEKRSLDANNYCWVLCKALADVLRITKEEVYREAIKDVGTFEILPLKTEAVEKFKYSWSRNGVGWVCQVLGESKLPGYTNIIAYYGSSTYNRKEMSILVDYLVQECKQQNIPTLEDKKIQNLLEAWDKHEY